jgi:hypothetical protein
MKIQIFKLSVLFGAAKANKKNLDAAIFSESHAIYIV